MPAKKPKRKPPPTATAIILSKATLEMLDDLRGDHTRAAALSALIARAHRDATRAQIPAASSVNPHLARNLGSTLERAYGR